MILQKKLDQSTAHRLWQQLEADEFHQLISRTTLFREIPLSTLPLSTLEKISEDVKIIRLAKNESLRIQQTEFLYEIISGYVKIYDRALQAGEKDKKHIPNPPALLAWRVPGELLGDFEFSFPGNNLTDHVVATDNCRLLKIPADAVHKLAERYPQFYRNIASNLASKAIKTRIRAQVLRLPNIESMVAKMFIELCKERGYDESINNLKVLNGTFHIKDIAAFLGYEYHGAQMGVHALIEAHLCAHYKSNKSGRFVIFDEEKLSKYLAEQQSIL